MAITVFHHNRTEVLADRLCDEIIDYFKNDDPFNPPVIFLPNRNIESWLGLTIAKRLGIAINLDFSLFETGMFALLSACLSSDQKKPQPLGMEATAIILFHLLYEHRSDDPNDDQALSAFLEHIRDRSGRQLGRYLSALSENIAILFREYEYHRQEMTRAWLGNERCLGTGEPVARLERAQQYLYRSIHGKGGILERLSGEGKYFTTLPRLFDRVIANDLLPGPDRRPLHLFGFSSLSRFHHECLFHLGRFRPIYFYQLNPCGQFWEDSANPSDLKTHDQEDNDLLRELGRVGREQLIVLSEIEDRATNDLQFEQIWLDPELSSPERDGVLGKIKQQIFMREQSRCSINQDLSLQIAGAPSERREIEAIRSSILTNLGEDPLLKLHDIAILLSDCEKYLPIIESVLKDLLYSLFDIDPFTRSSYIRGVRTLLGLIDDDFKRANMFELFRNPCFQLKWKVNSDDVEQTWLNWVDRLNILDQPFSDLDQVGYPAFSWTKGLRRIRQGRLMLDLPDHPSSVYDDLPVYRDLDSESNDSAEIFQLVVENLLALITPLKEQSHPWKIWAENITMLSRTFLAVPDQDRIEQGAARTWFSHLDEIAQFDDFWDGQIGDKTLPWSLVAQVFLHNLGGNACHRENGGIVVAPLKPMRPIPFRITYLVGLNEDVFPGRAKTRHFDLRRFNHQRGDLDQTSSNRYLFLESLISTREKLYLSYIDRDLKKDEEKHPSSVIDLLREYCNRSILPEGQTFTTYTIPLHSRSARYFIERPGGRFDLDRNLDPFGYDQTIAYLAGKSRRDPSFKRTISEELLAVGETARATLAARFSVAKSSPASEPESRPTLRALERFLANPLMAALGEKIDLDDPLRPDPADREDEPYQALYPHDRIIIRAIIDEKMTSPVGSFDLEKSLERIYERLRRKDQLPGGAFAKIDKKKLIRTLTALQGPLNRLLEEALPPVRYYPGIHFGKAFYGKTDFFSVRPFRLVTNLSPPLELSLSVRTIFQDRKGIHLLVPIKNRGLRTSELIRPFLLQLLLGLDGGPIAECFQGTLFEPAVHVHFLHQDEKEQPFVDTTHRFSLGAISPSTYFEELLRDWAGDDRFDYLEYDHVLKKQAFLSGPEPSAELDREFVRQLEILFDQEKEENKTWISDLIDVAIPDDALVKARRRLTPIIVDPDASPSMRGKPE